MRVSGLAREEMRGRDNVQKRHSSVRHCALHRRRRVEVRVKCESIWGSVKMKSLSEITAKGNGN